MRPIDADEFMKRLTLDTSKGFSGEFMDGSEVAFTSIEIAKFVEEMPTLTPQNEPLTIEQLRKMDGEPVWVTPLGFWALVIAKPGERVQLVSHDGETVWADKEIELVGPVYRWPPERQEDT